MQFRAKAIIKVCTHLSTLNNLMGILNNNRCIPHIHTIPITLPIILLILIRNINQGIILSQIYMDHRLITTDIKGSLIARTLIKD